MIEMREAIASRENMTGIHNGMCVCVCVCVCSSRIHVITGVTMRFTPGSSGSSIKHCQESSYIIDDSSSCSGVCVCFVVAVVVVVVVVACGHMHDDQHTCVCTS